jgi:hypothetical protein
MPFFENLQFWTFGQKWPKMPKNAKIWLFLPKFGNFFTKNGP